MEDLAPCMQLTNHILISLHSGQSVRSALKHSLKELSFEPIIHTELVELMKSPSYKAHYFQKTLFRRSFFALLKKGLQGLPIQRHLQNLQDEMQQQCHFEIEMHLKKLPLLLLIPMFLFYLPAIFLLFFAPLLIEMLSTFEG